MKIIILFLFTALWVSPSFGEPTNQLVRIDSLRIQALATKAILVKYPNVKSDDLAFSDLQYSLSANGEEQIAVTYGLTNTAKITVEGGWVTTKTKTTIVILSGTGKVKSFSEGQITTSSAKK